MKTIKDHKAFNDRKSCFSVIAVTFFYFIFLRLCCLCLGILLTCASSLSLIAQEGAVLRHFRVDSKVRMENKDLITEIETSTVFSNGAVFDFIGNNGEIIIYRKDKELFTLLDPIHRLQTELTLADIDSFLEKIRSLLLEKEDKFNQFMANPLFDITRSEAGDELFFQSKWLEYKIKLTPFEESGISEEYFLFSKVYSKLNIYLNPGATTPFARLQIDEELLKTGQFPYHFEISIYPKGKWFFGKTVKVDSHHTMVRRLSEQDKGRIMRALHFGEQFPKVPFGRYQKATRNID